MTANRSLCKIAFTLTIALLICSIGLINAERVVCSFSSSAADRMDEYSFEIADIPVSLCTHVVYDGLRIDFYTHELLPGNPPFDVLDNGWQKFSELKRTKPDLKLLISIRTPLMLQVAEDATSRKTFIENVLQHVEWMKLDGVELFWSGGNEEKLYLLIEELKGSFVAAGHPTWEVSVLKQIDQSVVDHARLCRLVDFVHVLGIGERKPKYHDNSSTPTAKTTLDVGKHKNVTLERALEHLIDANCPANKIVLVVILFAQTYTLGNVNTRDRPKELTTFCNITEGNPYCAYVEICQKFNESEWTLGSDDPEGFAPHAIQGNTWVAYENEASIGQKGEIARRKNLAGVYVFSLDLDDYRGKCGNLYPLTTALSRSFRGTAID
ncbi:endochitinase-like [Anopheles maculipalpis]|uniref:endochitinase-like n=1 Tax=Anopheles maculipalpis TaxID=1496333 RepID=UPI002158C31E|nr:endochitinase-like [Anopheles maculipalpis]